MLRDELDSAVAVVLQCLPDARRQAVIAALPPERQAVGSDLPPEMLEVLGDEIAAGLRAKIRDQVKREEAARAPSATSSRFAAAAYGNQSGVIARASPPPNPPPSQSSRRQAPTPANELSATLQRIVSPQLRENLSRRSVLPPSPSSPASPVVPRAEPPRPETKEQRLAAIQRQIRERREQMQNPASAVLATPATPTRRSPAVARPAAPVPAASVPAAPVPTAPPTTRPPRPFDKNSAINEEIARARLLAAQHPRGENIDGLALIASIIREAPGVVRENVLAAAPELYAALKKKMFVFADLEKSSASTLAKVFTAAPPEAAALALRFASDQLNERVRQAISSRRARLIEDEIAHAGKRVRLADIETAQQQIIDLAVELQRRGEVIIDAAAADVV
ncbi:hypothetical protein FACS1894139_17880 [Planctomycetales bacterium]|nr:hypothetical protein FACS1894107_12850 [Planctomycetales bacterium]GHT08321.1 hypothetical protein FACS1894139_17880 [Planctomycetales bacterium]